MNGRGRGDEKDECMMEMLLVEAASELNDGLGLWGDAPKVPKRKVGNSGQEKKRSNKDVVRHVCWLCAAFWKSRGEKVNN